MCLIVDHLIQGGPELNPPIKTALCSEHMSHEGLQRLSTGAQTNDRTSLDSRLGLPPLQSVMSNFFLSHKAHCFSDVSRADSVAMPIPDSQAIWTASQLCNCLFPSKPFARNFLWPPHSRLSYIRPLSNLGASSDWRPWRAKTMSCYVHRGQVGYTEVFTVCK